MGRETGSLLDLAPEKRGPRRIRIAQIKLGRGFFHPYLGAMTGRGEHSNEHIR
jgi:hypothetical protein